MTLGGTPAPTGRGCVHPERTELKWDTAAGTPAHSHGLAAIISDFPALNGVLPAFLGESGCG